MDTPASSNKDLWVEWDEYHRLIEELALKVYQSGWQFDQVLCLARGGLRPGDVFSRIFDVPLAVLSASSYRSGVGTVQGDLEIGRHIALTKGELRGRVLLLDDLVDSGITLKQVSRYLSENFPEVTEVQSAVIWWKACSAFEPDFHIKYLPDNPWIHQPFEAYDSIRPHQLYDRLKKGND